MPKQTKQIEKEPRINLRLKQNPIAIVGMASLFPGAENLQEYWENIIGKVDCITEVPTSRWDAQTYFDPDPKALDKTYCKRGGFIPDVDFNPMEFGIPPNLLEVTDISQLLALAIATQALEDAGYGKSKEFDREHVGVILGVAAGRQLAVPFGARLQYPIWEKALKSYGLSEPETQAIIAKIKSAYPEWEENAFPGMLANIVSGRIANRLDLGGVNCTVDAACASSLAAFKIAVSELTEGRCNMMLTGGVDVDNSIFAYLCFSKTPALSRQQQVRPFDIDSDGMMLGEGLGMMVLKRLEDAERDQDRIYAVIKGIGTSSDGRYKSIYAPSVSGQVKALQRAYEDAGIPPASVGLIEAHGTGTMVGDPTEFAALDQVFSSHAAGTIALGSVKSQIGHTKAAAGTASMIKAALALHHQVLPPTINVTQPNPRLKMESSAFYLNTEARPWIRSDAPRRAGVSSFGFGGTNYHIVLEEYEPAHKNGYRLHRTPQPILLQAATPNQLVQVCEQCLQQLHSEEGDRSFAILVETSKSMEIPIDAARLGFVAISGAEASQKLASAIACLKGQLDGDSWEHPTGIFYRRQGLDLTGKVVALFSGQGSQYLNMGRELVMNFPELQQTFAEVDELFMQADLEPPSQRVFPTPAFSKDQTQAQAQELQRTEFAQPALGAFSVGLYKLLHKAGFRPDFLAGHSFGELTALWAAKVLTDADYFSLVKARSQAMAKPTEADAGTMMAVKGEVHAVETIVKSFPGVAIANRNSPQQLVLAGTRADLEPVQIALKKQKFSTVWLPVSAAFHTSLVDYAQQPFAAAVETAQLQTPQVPIYTNVTARPYPDDVEAMRSNLKAHMSQPVLFTEQIEHLYNAGGYCFVEFGPRRVLTNLVQETLGDRPHLAIALNASRQKDSDLQLREALIQLRVAGLPLKDLDPYQRLLEAPRSSRTEKKLNVRLNGNNYVSTKTQQSIAALETVASSRVLAFDPSISVLQPELTVITNDRPVPLAATTAAQANGHLELSGGHNNNGRQLNGDRRSQANGPPSDPMKSNSHRSDPTRATASCSQGSVAGRTQPSASNRSAARLDGSADRILDSMEHLLSHFNQHHSETLQTHQQYLNNHLAYTQGFLQLMHRQNDLLLDGDIPADQTSITSEVMGSLERNLMQFHRHQAETLKTHDQSISAHGEYAKHFFQLIQQQYGQLITPVTPEPMHPPQPEVANRSPNPLIDALIPQSELSLPSDWVEPNGLSVDSERPLNFTNGTLVSSSLNPSIADLTVPLNGMNSVAESAISNGNLAIAQSEANATHFMDQDPVETIAGPTEVAAAIEVVHLSQALLAVVSDKTGYPIEMLELEMDMEADLGIDSIKRFEILGALMEQYPEFPQPDLEALAEVEMRTLNQVVVLMQSLSPAQASSSSLSISSDTDSSLAVSQDLERVTNGPDLAPPLIREELEVGAPDIVSNAAATAIAESVLPVNSSAIDRETLRQALLLVVSDKTGYPVEMLEPNMDMEADLGIDSIKRFEILGALMEQYPEFPQPDLEALAEVEMRTLDQVIDFMQSQFTEKKKNSLTVEEHKPEQPSTTLSRRPVHLEFLPPPDKMDFTLADQHITVLTDYGSPITAQVAQSLLDLGWRVVILRGPHAVDSPLPRGVDRVVLQDASEAHLEQQLGAIATQYGSIGAFIHLHPTFATTPTCLFLEEDAAIVKQVFLIAKHLKIALNQAASLGRSCFLTVAYLDGELGLSGKANFSPISAGLFGLTKSLNWEWDSVFCRAIDLSPDLDMATSLGYVLAELQDPNRLITEVGYGPNGRTTLVC